MLVVSVLRGSSGGVFLGGGGFFSPFWMWVMGTAVQAIVSRWVVELLMKSAPLSTIAWEDKEQKAGRYQKMDKAFRREDFGGS